MPVQNLGGEKRFGFWNRESASPLRLVAGVLSFLLCLLDLPLGSTLRSDGSANEKLYGQKLTAKEIVRDGKVKAPPSASELVALLDKKSPKNHSDPKSLE
ncbi:MAG: hypothetical protein DMG72_04475 [Acidobacteria bacterium]|nr:MAG: hypothetical protein DMG72_04475 [Acidobacteriota bacterium]